MVYITYNIIGSVVIINTISWEDVMTLRLMRIFRSVAEHTSFSRASEELSITRPAVSQAITQLEEHLQVKLFNRTTRRVELTPEGDLYYHHVIDILERMEQMEEQLQVPFDGPAGRIRIEVCPSIAKTFLLPHILSFQAEYPNIEILLGTNASSVNFHESAIDFTFQLGSINQLEVNSHELGMVDFVCCASPIYIKKHGAPKSLEALTEHKAINYFSQNTGRIIPWPFIENNTIRNVIMEHDIATNDIETCLEYAVAGKGIVVISNFLAKHKIAEGLLIPILDDNPIASQPLSMVYSANKSSNKKLQIFIDWMSKIPVADTNSRLS